MKIKIADNNRMTCDFCGKINKGERYFYKSKSAFRGSCEFKICLKHFSEEIIKNLIVEEL